MKRTCFIFLFFFLGFYAAQAQNTRVVGMTIRGGEGGGGTIFSAALDGSDLTVLQNFNALGAYPYGSLIEGSNGMFYGMTAYSGLFNRGIIFRIAADGTGFEKLFDFDRRNGSTPQGSLLLGSNGKLYGMTARGGLRGDGIIFRINEDGTGFETMHEFSGTDGDDPYGSLIEGSDGHLYGITRIGGLSNGGVIFRLDTIGSHFTKLYDLGGTNGKDCRSSLVEGEDGWLYGQTYKGGSSDAGVIFRAQKNGMNFEKLHDFKDTTTNGAYPNGSLALINDTTLYGMTTGGGPSANRGVIFRIGVNGKGFNILHNFNYSDGYAPRGSLVAGNEEILYGMTRDGGSYGYGVIFQIGLDDGSFSKMHDFSRDNGLNPNGSLARGNDGRFYGMTRNGGSFGTGMIFRIRADGTNFENLHDFDNAEGAYPHGSLIQGRDAMLYGMTHSGGGSAPNYGVIFRTNSDGTGFTKLHNFDQSNGSGPLGDLLEGGDGKFYGMTYGNVFRMNSDGTDFEKLHDFEYDTANGFVPYGSLIEGIDGGFYGMTYSGGADYQGIVFRINADGSGFEKLHDFKDTAANGTRPFGSLLEGNDRRFYGMAGYGGLYEKGIVFCINADGSGFEKLHDFNGADGSSPHGSLLQGSDGKLYGMTRNGGSSGYGVIFRLNAAGTDFEKLHDFDNAKGRSPLGRLTEGSGSLLYGMTSLGGTFDGGVIFRIGMDGTGFEILYDLDNTTGFNPQYGSLIFIEVPETQNIIFEPFTNKTYGDAPFFLSASATSGLPVSFTSSNAGIASISEDMLTIYKAGNIAITATQAGNDQYYPAKPVKQGLTIEKAVLTAQADDKRRTFGQPNPEFSITYSGFVNGEDKSVLSAEPDITVNIDENSTPGEYPIILSGGEDENYAFVLINGILTIEQILGLTPGHESLVIYPNPVNDILKIQFDDPFSGTIEITDINGRKMLSETLRNRNEHYINVAAMPAKIYVVTISNGKTFNIVKLLKR